ncbi:carboxymuconolactone decarboxylase family protein [Pseudomonas putida group bacterium ESBL64]|uniref:carboxymuconolactone decarboxylase family protein n=1 Tax=Pseudomonas putida group bacterium ESBL64 TaxID=3122582 RepID=UPI0030DFBC87
MSWNESLNTVLNRFAEFSKLSPDTSRGLATVANVPVKHLDKKTHELIALAVAITTRCDTCIALHAKEAVSIGVTKEEVAEALSVAISLNAGAAASYTAKTFDALSSFSVTQ